MYGIVSMADEYNFKDPELRGILTIIANKHDVNRSAICMSIKRGSGKYIEEINKEIKKRIKAREEFKRLIQK